MWEPTLLLLALQAFTVSAKLRTYNWDIGWVSASPDGYTRPFVGINNAWPCPAINVTVGDVIKINVRNSLGNESTAIHFHGLFQRGTNIMDGPAMVTQCPIQPGGTFVYEFTVSQTGTYWYHAHIGGQYIDGFRGPLIVTDPKRPFRVDKEYVLTVSDVYHQQAPPLINYYQSPDNYNNNQGAEPVPDSVLINEAQGSMFTILPGKTYMFRVINIGAMMPYMLQFDQHTMTIVEVDGIYTVPHDVDQLFIAVAQRYSVLITAKPDKTSNFAIVAQMNTDMLVYSWLIPDTIQYFTTAYLVYDPALPVPHTFVIQQEIWDDTLFVPLDAQPLLSGTPDVVIELLADFGANGASQQRGNFNGISYTPQKVPTLFTALTAPADMVMNPTIYGANSNPYVVPYGSLVEITIANHDFNAHPFHLHGHAFQVVDRSSAGTLFPGMGDRAYPPSPMRRDTIVVPGSQYAKLRFIADNPGIQLFHCHIEWHVEAGLTATIIEAPDKLQAMKPYIPASHKAQCAKGKIPMKGNAAGKVVATKKVPGGWMNLTGANFEAPINPWGALVNPPVTSTKRSWLGI